MNRKGREEKQETRLKFRDDIFLITHSEDVHFIRSFYFVIFYLKYVQQVAVFKGNLEQYTKYKHMTVWYLQKKKGATKNKIRNPTFKASIKQGLKYIF